MAELRWILAIAGVGLIAGLWWWESRRRQAVRKAEPVSIPEPEVAATESTPKVATSQPVSEPERRPLPRQLPTLDLPEGAEPELKRPAPSIAPLRERPALGVDEPPQVQESGVTLSIPGEHNKAARRQRVLAFRLVPVESKWKGRDLMAAFAAEGLRFGRYSVFHRSRDGGQTIFHAASLNEPGSFDYENMDGQLFSGASLFAVIPGPLDAETTLDIMLMTAKRLVGELGGRIQDEMGRPLTNQALILLREEIVKFEQEGPGRGEQ